MTAPVRELVEQIAEDTWTPLADYPATGEAQIAETTLGGRRLIVRRVRTLAAQGELFPDWQHFPFVTNRDDEVALVEAEHRAHATIELVIRDLKEQALARFPSGQFAANAAWTVIAALAHNLLRWTEQLGVPERVVRTARSVRRRLLTLPAASPHTPVVGRFTCLRAGRGSRTSSKRSAGSERSRPPPERTGHVLRSSSSTRRDHRCPQTPPRATLPTGGGLRSVDSRRLRHRMCPDHPHQRPINAEPEDRRWIQAESPPPGSGLTSVGRVR